MAQLSKPAIPAKMYRQFAIVTIATTAGLALMTNGASEMDTAGDRPTTRASTAPRASSTPRYGQAQFKTGSTVEVSDGFDDYDGTYETKQGASNGRRNISAVNEIGATETSAQGSENGAFTRDYLASLSDEELDELLRQLRAGGVEDPAVRRQVMQLLETGARRRAGRATNLE